MHRDPLPGQTDQERELIAWAQAQRKGTLATARLLTGGNRRKTWALSFAHEEGRTSSAILRLATGTGDQGADPYTLRREAAVYAALNHTGTRLARLYGVHPVHHAVLIELVEGESVFRAIDSPDRRTAIALDFVEAIHHLHQVPLADLDLPGVPASPRMADHVRQEIDIWRGMYEEMGSPDPLIELAFAWLQQHVPETSAKPVVVHGDAGPGNFMFQGAKMAALIDWELWHTGDPVEDLAWVSVRSVLEPVPDFPALVRRYESLSGAPVDRPRFFYHQLMVLLRIVVIRHRALGVIVPDSDLSNSLVTRQMSRRHLVHGLAKALGVPVPATAPADPAVSDHDHYYEFALAQLQNVVLPACTEPRAATKVKSVARILKYLRQRDRLGAAFRAQEQDDLFELMGEVPTDIGAGREALAARIRSATVDQGAAMNYLLSQNQRESTMGRTAMGAMADRALPTIDP